MTMSFFTFCFLSKNKSFKLFVFFALAFFTGGYLLYTALAELIITHRLYSLLITIGSITSLLQLIIYASELEVIKRHSQLIFEITYLLSFALISSAGILMII
jgi:hypothetical protein